MSLKDKLIKPDNIGEQIPVPNQTIAPQTPPLIPREQAGLANATLGPAPSVWTTDYDRVRQWARPGMSQNRFPPLPTKANPQINAAARSVATAVVLSTPAPSGGDGGGATTAELTIPNIFTPTDQTVTLPGPLAFSLAAENPNTFLGVLPPGLSSIEAFTSGSVTTTTGTSGLTLSATPTTATSWGLFVDNCQGNETVTPPAGWTALAGNNFRLAGYWQSFTGTTPISVSQAAATNSGVLNALLLFSGASPTIVQQADSGNFTTSGTATFGLNTTAGNTIIILMGGGQQTGVGTTGLSFTATGGNFFSTLMSQNVQNGSVTCNSTVVAICPNCVGGAVSVTGTLTKNGSTGGANALLQILELGPLPSGPSIPQFIPLVPDVIPPINLQKNGNGGVFGLLPVGSGGTGANLASTGGASNVLQQASSGGAVTVGQLAFSDLTGSITPATQATSGLASAKTNLLTQTTNTAATTLYTVPVGQGGTYLITVYTTVSRAATVSSTLPDTQLFYTDAESSNVYTLAATPSNSGNTLATSQSASFVINAKGFTNIQFAIGQVTPYASSGATSMQFAYHVRAVYAG